MLSLDSLDSFQRVYVQLAHLGRRDATGAVDDVLHFLQRCPVHPVEALAARSFIGVGYNNPETTAPQPTHTQPVLNEASRIIARWEYQPSP